MHDSTIGNTPLPSHYLAPLTMISVTDTEIKGHFSLFIKVVVSSLVYFLELDLTHFTITGLDLYIFIKIKEFIIHGISSIYSKFGAY